MIQPLWQELTVFEKVHCNFTKKFFSIYTPKRNDNISAEKNFYWNVDSSFIHNSQKLATVHMSITFCEWKNKMYYIPIIEYYPAIKRNNWLIHGVAWMNIKTIILPKMSQTQRLYIEWFFFYEISKKTNSRDKTDHWVFGARHGSGNCWKWGIRVFCSDGNIVKLDVVIVVWLFTNELPVGYTLWNVSYTSVQLS